MKGGEMRQSRAVPSGLSLSQRRALVLARHNDGLVRLERVWRASFRAGSEKVRTLTVESLIAGGLLARTGETLARLTEAGRAIAMDCENMAREAVQSVESQRQRRARRFAKVNAGKAKARKAAQRPAETPITTRLPYVD